MILHSGCLVVNDGVLCSIPNNAHLVTGDFRGGSYSLHVDTAAIDDGHIVFPATDQLVFSSS